MNDINTWLTNTGISNEANNASVAVRIKINEKDQKTQKGEMQNVDNASLIDHCLYQIKI